MLKKRYLRLLYQLLYSATQPTATKPTATQPTATQPTATHPPCNATLPRSAPASQPLGLGLHPPFCAQSNPTALPRTNPPTTAPLAAARGERQPPCNAAHCAPRSRSGRGLGVGLPPSGAHIAPAASCRLAAARLSSRFRRSE